MIWKQVELHNVSEARPVGEGVDLLRVPPSVQAHLNPDAQRMALGPAGVEIRFCCDGPATVRMSCAQATRIHIYYGAFRGEKVVPIEAGSCTFTVEPAERVQRLTTEAATAAGFAPDVVRLRPHGPLDEVLTLESVTADGLRPPRPDQAPPLRYLAFGTSITQGVGATGPHLSFPALLAHWLGADLINLGFAGSCHCEPEIADHIAGRDDWDFATFCISTNMIGAGFSPDAFRERADYLLRTVTAAHPGKPVVCLSVLPHFRDVPMRCPAPEAGTVDAYRAHLAEAVIACASPAVHYVDGRDALPSPSLLLTDMTHPGDLGMIQVATHLLPILQSALASP